jgi:uracil-DNA glycosylase family 4
MNPRPIDCPIPGSQGCVPATGPLDAPILLIGESAGRVEAYRGEPFVGPAGGMLDRLLEMAGIKREECRIVNTIACHPSNDYLVGAPWEEAALRHCRPQLEAILAEPHRVIVPLGATALRAVYGWTKKQAGRVEDFHGSPAQVNGRWVVPTFHPSYLQRGAQKLTKTVVFDLTVAKEIAQGVWEPDYPSLVIDPSTAWFEDWVDRYLTASADAWLAVDIETPDKSRTTDEGELGRDDQSYQILRLNLSCSTDEGVTIPWQEPWITIAKRALSADSIKILWNATYDCPRLEVAGAPVHGRIYDFMDFWHVLQSSLPRGLGFVAPFYSGAGPWKHLGNRDLTYCALDGVQTLRCAFGIAKDLESEGLWSVALRRMWQLDSRCFRPAERAGLMLVRDRLEDFNEQLGAALADLDREIQGMVPDSVRPLAGPWKRRPDEDGYTEVRELLTVQICRGCGAGEVQKRHRCTDKALVPDVTLAEREVSRWYRREPFNPASWQQVMAYTIAKGHKPGKAKKTKKDSVDKKTLTRLVKTGDPFFSKILEFRQIAKIKGTYAESMIAKMDAGGRVHPTFTNTPTTLRKSCVSPNLQNVANHVQFADGFRRCVVAAPAHSLVELDFSGIEAVETGWFMGDPGYIRLAKLGVHAYVASHLVGQPASLAWEDSALKAHFKRVKAEFPEQYDRAKRCVHGRNYGLTEHGMSDYYPEIFPTRPDAKRVIDLYEEVCPNLAPWQHRVRLQAHNQHYLGGPLRHPFGYKHWFWDVINYTRIGGKWKEAWGEDAKRALAFFPQSTAMGVIQEAMLRLFDADEGGRFIGDACSGETPLRAQIHDSLLLEIPDAKVDEVLAAAVFEMTSPILQQPCPVEWKLGPHLQIGVEAKVGKNWAPRTESNPDGMQVVGVEDLAADSWREESDEEAELAQLRA